MASSRVLRIPHSEVDGAFVLVQVTSSGSKALDLKLVATEGEAPYVVKLKHDRVLSLRVKNCPVSEDEWQSIMESFFNQLPLDEINATASVQSESSIAITIRKEVQGITQRLGTITLSHDENEAIELLEWCAVSAEAVVANKAVASKAEEKNRELESAVDALKTQLDELVAAKAEDETALLHKFRDLLNEKKIKIREQHKVISSSSFNAPKATAVAEPESETEPAPAPARKGRKPAQSRAGKRKAAASAPKDESEDEGAAAEEPRIKSEPEETDGHSTEDTASTAGDDSDEEMGDDAAQEPQREPPSAGSEKKTVHQPPPKRDLPFANRKPAAPSKPAPAGHADSDSDDEL
ncbi:hypothetical protein K4F52_002538 [Lecanicillium sp. MT-2017a]|nr:hypothetical protein K4F52_002538 [Lecanicillium sp. MT-2017a]